MGDYIFFSLGIIIVIISIIMLKKNMNMQSKIEFEMDKNDEIEIIEGIDLAENIIKELKEISEDTIKTLDHKTNDIYQMIKILDEKMEQYSKFLSEKENQENVDKFKVSSSTLDLKDIKKEDPILDSDRDKKTILQLYNQGYTPSQIAKKLDKGIGEVQLICSLKKR